MSKIEKMSEEFEEKFRKALDLLQKYVPDEPGRKKPIIPHCTRVGFYLYENGYSEEIVSAGILHDIIEWTNSPEDLIREEFGKKVFDIVMANTQNSEIKDKVEKWQDMVNRCAEYGKDALIVKTADVLDSYKFYIEAKNEDEVERSRSIGKYILEKLPAGVEDPIFDELRKVVKIKQSDDIGDNKLEGKNKSERLRKVSQWAFRFFKSLIVVLIIGLLIAVFANFSSEPLIKFSVHARVDGGNTTFDINKQTLLPLLQEIEGSVVIASHIHDGGTSEYCEIQRFPIFPDEFDTKWFGIRAYTSKYVATADYSPVFINRNLKEVLESETYVLVEAEYSSGLPFRVASNKLGKEIHAYKPFMQNDKVFDLLEIRLQDIPEEILGGELSNSTAKGVSLNDTLDKGELDCANFMLKNLLGTEKEMRFTVDCEECMIQRADR